MTSRGHNDEPSSDAQIHRALQEAEAKYRSLVENSPVGVYLIRGDRFLYVNPRLATMLGYSEEDLVGRIRVIDVIAPHDRERVARNLKRRLAGEDVEEWYTFQAVRKDGALIDVELYGTRAIVDGEPAAQGMVLDVTEQIRAQRAVQESEQKFRMLAESAEAAIGIIQERRFVYANPYLARASGYSHDELMEIDVAQLVHPDDREMVINRLARRLAGERLVSHYEFRMVTKTGHQRWLEISPARIDYRGQPAIVGIAYDITERREATEALRRSEEKYRQLVEDVSDWVWAVDAEGRYTYVSPAIERILGYAPEEVVGRTPFDLLVPEERESVRAVFERAVRARQEISNLLNRNLRKDGQVRYLETSGRPVFDNGDLVGYRGVDRDVTERTLAEERMRELEEHKRDFYRRTIMAATEGKLIITEPDDICEHAGDCLGVWRLTCGEELSRVRQDVMELARAAGMDEDRAYDYVLCVGEATTNAVKHANGGDASLHRNDDSLLFVVSDRGKGIEALALPEVALKRGYTTAVSLGMGYKAMISIADRVYLATCPTGTTVGIEMRLRRSEEPLLAAGIPDTWRAGL